MSIEVVDMSTNDFSGDTGLPTTIGQWEECEQIIFRGSGIGGPIPKEIGALSKLERLDLAMNKKESGGDGITGGIPTEVGMLFSLEKLTLHENSMTGEFVLL